MEHYYFRPRDEKYDIRTCRGCGKRTGFYFKDKSECPGERNEMAKVRMTMDATGLHELNDGAEHCYHCQHLFDRGETMTAVESDDGDPLGWFCRPCVDAWPRGVGTPVQSETQA